jgi:proteasome lid subunit RPN8/RPN11
MHGKPCSRTRQGGLQLIGIYHSHPGRDAYFDKPVVLS